MRTYVTVNGNLTNDPVTRFAKDGARIAEFGLAHNHMRLDRARGVWEETGRTFYTVTCWRKLAEGVETSLHKGDPAIVSGVLTSREYVRNDGTLRLELKIEAKAVGPDLSRSIAAVNRGARPTPPATDAGDEQRRLEPVPDQGPEDEFDGEDEAEGSLVDALPGERP